MATLDVLIDDFGMVYLRDVDRGVLILALSSYTSLLKRTGVCSRFLLVFSLDKLSSRHKVLVLVVERNSLRITQHLHVRVDKLVQMSS